MGSLLACASKNLVPSTRSDNNIVIATTEKGVAIINKADERNTPQANIGVLY